MDEHTLSANETIADLISDLSRDFGRSFTSSEDKDRIIDRIAKLRASMVTCPNNTEN